jgi:hypothetical protein
MAAEELGRESWCEPLRPLASMVALYEEGGDWGIDGLEIGGWELRSRSDLLRRRLKNEDMVKRGKVKCSSECAGVASVVVLLARRA